MKAHTLVDGGGVCLKRKSGKLNNDSGSPKRKFDKIGKHNTFVNIIWCKIENVEFKYQKNIAKTIFLWYNAIDGEMAELVEGARLEIV